MKIKEKIRKAFRRLVYKVFMAVAKKRLAFAKWRVEKNTRLVKQVEAKWGAEEVESK